MQNLVEHYCKMKTPSIETLDIHEHLDTLFRYAKECRHITEFGFRNGTSFTAFLMAQPETLVTYDIKFEPTYIETFKPMNYRTNVFFNQMSTLDAKIEETDLLFIDTLHTYGQLSQELKLHGNKARKYLIFHDTQAYRHRGEDGTDKGLYDAILEFIEENPHWAILEDRPNNNGLLVAIREK